MQYELTESEIQHIEKYRKLWAQDKEVLEELIDRMVELNTKIDQLPKEAGGK